MTVALGTLNFGSTDYWAKFGERFHQSVLRCDPQPDQIIIATDKPNLDYPKEYEVLQYSGGFEGINLLAQRCNTTWLFFAGLDDEFLPHAFRDVDSTGDIIQCQGQSVGVFDGLAMPGAPGTFELAHEWPSNPVTASSIMRVETLLEIPMRANYGYHDEVCWAEWAYFGKKCEKIEPFPRQILHRWHGSSSWPANREYERQAQDFKTRLRAGLIQKGVPE